MSQTAVIALFSVVVAYYLQSKLTSNEPPIQVTEKLEDAYDYIVVGSGTAGSVLAARLSEKPNVKVLLLEAGGQYDAIPTSHVPGLWPTMLHTDLDWDYYSEPQRNACLGQNNQQAYLPRGHVLGGSNVLNLLQYTRGNRVDFDKWEENGCTGWSYDKVLPYFKKSENILIPELKSSEYHGKGGPMGVSDGRVTELHDLYLTAGQEMGYKINDYNGEKQEGFSAYQLSVDNGVRVSTAKFYLETASRRPNLHIGIRSFVTKIGFEGKRATGVFVVRNAKKSFIAAKKEVIVSGGAINTPQLLLLSGIGPKKHLKEMGIPLIQNLPVGENLQDHPRIQAFASIEKPLSVVADSKTSLWNKLNQQLFGEGPLAKTSAEVAAFYHTDPKNRGRTDIWTDGQMNLFSSLGGGNTVNVKDNLHKEIFRQNKKYGFTAALIMNHLKSKGTITLRTTDPFDYPIVQPNYLTEKSDVDDFVKAIRFWESFTETPTIKSLGVSIEHMKLSVCKDFEFRTDAYWECYVRHFVMTTYHQCCTCKMGAEKDETAVVDPKLRVKGIQNLRVVDASILPEETSGNLNAPIVMVAERAAEFILEDF